MAAEPSEKFKFGDGGALAVNGRAGGGGVPHTQGSLVSRCSDTRDTAAGRGALAGVADVEGGSGGRAVVAVVAVGGARGRRPG